MSKLGSPKRLRWLLVSLVSVGLALFSSTQVLGVLWGILLPPSPPFYPAMQLQRHESAAYGVDDWLWLASADPCQVAQFYVDAGGVCEVPEDVCGMPASRDLHFAGEHVGRCIGETTFSLFAQRWQAIIASGQPSADGAVTSVVRLVREVFWTGAVPPLPQNDDPANFFTP